MTARRTLRSTKIQPPHLLSSPQHSTPEPGSKHNGTLGPTESPIRCSVRPTIVKTPALAKGTPRPVKNNRTVIKKKVTVTRSSLGGVPARVPRARKTTTKTAKPDDEPEQAEQLERPEEPKHDTIVPADEVKMDVIEDNSTSVHVIAETVKVETKPKVTKTTLTKAARKAPAKKPVTKITKTTRQRGTEIEKTPESEIEVDHDVKVIFADFKITKVINESSLSKTITLMGTYHNQPAVLRLEKTVFDETAVSNALSSNDINTERDFVNDIYSSYTISTDKFSKLNGIKGNFICPASESVITKYTRSETILYSETPDAYLKVVEPYITNKLMNEFNYNNWVYNILEGKSEVDRVIFNDTDSNSGFILVPDLKWSGDEKDLNLVAICHRRDIRSLRDLNDKHLILLKNIMTKGTKAIKDKYKKIKGTIRSYVHYHPSFYHFHVHFKLIDASEYLATDRDHLLSTIISNISLNKDYYTKSTLTYPLSQDSGIYKDLKQAKRI